jgi:ketosteroid isomerase-like protein
MDAEATRAAVTAYYDAVSRGDIEAVLAMFGPDAVMRDPVGQPPASDDMARRQRYAGIGAAFSSFRIDADRVYASPGEAATVWTARARTKGGKDVTFSGASTFTFDANGKIASMSAYWEPATVAKALQP